MKRRFDRDRQWKEVIIILRLRYSVNHIFSLIMELIFNILEPSIFSVLRIFISPPRIFISLLRILNHVTEPIFSILALR